MHDLFCYVVAGEVQGGSRGEGENYGNAGTLAIADAATHAHAHACTFVLKCTCDRGRAQASGLEKKIQKAESKESIMRDRERAHLAKIHKESSRGAAKVQVRQALEYLIVLLCHCRISPLLCVSSTRSQMGCTHLIRHMPL